MLLQFLLQCLERMIDVGQGGLSGMILIAGRRLLRKQIDDDRGIRAFPGPGAARFGIVGLAIVAKIFVHARPLLTKRQGQALLEIIVGGNAVCLSLIHI